MNYTSFFVAFSAVGVLVFVGIFGAAWLSATEPHTKGDRIPVVPPQTPDDLSEPSTTEWTSDSPIATGDGLDSSTVSFTTQFSNTPGSEEDTVWTDVSPSLTSDGSDSLTTQSLHTPSSEENTSWTGVSPSLTSEGSDSSTTDASSFSHTDTPVIRTREESPKFPEISKDPSKSSPVDPSSSTEDCEEIEYKENKGEIKPEFYYNKNNCKRWLVKCVEGVDVDITVERLDLDGYSGDYVLISPDKYTETDENNPVLSWKLTKPKQYKILGDGTASIKFVTFKSSKSNTEEEEEEEEEEKLQGGFRIVFRCSGELTTTEPPSTISPIPSPDTKESIIVSIGIRNFTEQEDPFKDAVATQANNFCEENNITLVTSATSENVYILSLTQCLPTWSEGKNCITMTIAIPVDTGSKRYELKKENLQKMWDAWEGKELEKIGIKKITGPNYKHNVIMSAIICSAFIILFSVCLVFLWKWQLRNTLTQEETKPRPSAPIEVPPLFDYLDTRLDDVPEYMPYYDSMYQMGAETSTDYSISYGPQSYNQRSNNFGSATFQFSRPSSAGIDNNSFIPEEDEEEYEIMNRASLTQEVKKMNYEKENKTTELHGSVKEETSS